jgi:hypothetical protein
MMLKLCVFVVCMLSVTFANDLKTINGKDQNTTQAFIQSEKEIKQLDALYGIQGAEERAQYQREFLKLFNLAMKVDTDNQVLKEKFNVQEKYYEIVLKDQEKRYETEMDHQTLIYSLAFGAVLIAGFFMNWLGFQRIKSYTNQIVQSEHGNAINEIATNLSDDEKFRKKIESIVKMEVEKQNKESFEGDLA